MTSIIDGEKTTIMAYFIGLVVAFGPENVADKTTDAVDCSAQISHTTMKIEAMAKSCSDRRCRRGTRRW